MRKTDQRRYIRIAEVIPIEFYLKNKIGEKITPWLQGFTSDIGHGGVCLKINDLWWEFGERLNNTEYKIFLKIDPPLIKSSLYFEGKVAWLTGKKIKEYTEYKAGIIFDHPKNKESRNLFFYALVKKILPYFSVGLIFVSIFLGAAFFHKINVLRQQRQKVSDYVRILTRVSEIERQVFSGEDEDYLTARQDEIGKELTALNNFLSDKQAMDNTEDKAVKEAVERVRLEIEALQNESMFLSSKTEQKKSELQSVKQEYSKLLKTKHIKSHEIISGMLAWIENRQDLGTGLVLSYEGDRDLNKICFTYDQSLAAIVFTITKKIVNVERILDFYLEKIQSENKIYNGYYSSGRASEYIEHSGPVCWIGLAALIYEKETGSKKYRDIADYAERFMLDMTDAEGGIKGGPTVTWYATEHHIDAYGFFDLFYKLTNDYQHLKYRDKVKSWLIKYAYTKYGSPVKRGKGDSTIATDTYSWSITSIGPDGLLSSGMNPENMLEFAEENCKVSTTFIYRDRKNKITGFDFSKFKNIPRGGVVSGEWTSQMILAYEIMAQYYFIQNDEQKYRQYMDSSLFYFNELQKMLITSLSHAGREDPCLPYATAELADTGHGWRTPKGNRTGSLAATSYFLLAYYGYNPLQGEWLEISIKNEDSKKINTD